LISGKLHRAALSRCGFATTFLQQTFFEGARDALFDRVRPLLYVGYGWNSERTAVLQLGELLGMRTSALFLVDERFAHLDTALCPLGSGHVMAYLDAFSERSQQMLRREIEPDQMIALERDDALAFAGNAVEVGGTIVLHSASRRLRGRLNAAGYRVWRNANEDTHWHVETTDLKGVSHEYTGTLRTDGKFVNVTNVLPENDDKVAAATSETDLVRSTSKRAPHAQSDKHHGFLTTIEHDTRLLTPGVCRCRKR